ncbi:hypothetical protein [Primorskyibacter flagellatus]|uniref:hypothetical protein n=1 Tax=Primorskyibacter flagellatus TaxID=1387277 RepID=UPI003A8E1EE7
MILPIGVAFVGSKGAVLWHGVHSTNGLFVCVVDTKKIEEVFTSSQSLRNFANYYSLTFTAARNVLEANNVRVMELLKFEYERGDSLEKLSARHGPKSKTLSGWLQRYGVQIRDGNEKSGIDNEELTATLRETCSINKAAQKAGIHWETAARRLGSSTRKGN